MAHKTSKPVPLAAETGPERENRGAALSASYRSTLSISGVCTAPQFHTRAHGTAIVVVEFAIGEAATIGLFEEILHGAARALRRCATATPRDVAPLIGAVGKIRASNSTPLATSRKFWTEVAHEHPPL
jgi:hypothetical protein